jgi:hypothetical protein
VPVDIEKLLRSDAHREFVASLSSVQAKAMLDLLLVGSLVDDIVTIEERHDIARTFTEHPDLSGMLDLFSAPLIDHIDALAGRWNHEPEAVLDEITEGLGDRDTLENALGATIFVMRTDQLVDAERAFVRELAERWELDPAFVQAALIEVTESQ